MTTTVTINTFTFDIITNISSRVIKTEKNVTAIHITFQELQLSVDTKF